MSTVFITEDDTRPIVIGQGPFEGQTVGLEGGSGADNQVAPDVVRVADTERASAIWLYEDGQTAGVGADICVPHRSLFFGFGYEAIDDAGRRREVLQRSIDWLMTEPLTRGLTVANVTDPVLIARPGERVSHVVRVHHIGSAGVTDTVSLSVQGDEWPTVVVPKEIELPPCTSALFTVTVALPLEAAVNAIDVLTLEVKSTQVPVPLTISVTTKTPAPVLLVDDDRWYPVQDLYTEAMSAAHIPFDVWDTRSGLGGTPTAYSPPTATLTMYPVVVWFTGYDWYAPIVPEEAQRLLAYLDQGGRLLLSSQDFVYHHEDEPLAHRLGILLADWSEQATEAMGVAGHPAGGAWGPSRLVFPFPNWSHIVEPAPDATPVARGQLGQPLGIAAGKPVLGASQTLFYALPLEALPPEPRAEALANGIGWLSPLGGTEWDVSSRAGPGGVTATFSLQLRNSWREALRVGVRHQVPDGFEVVSKSVPPGLVYEPTARQLTWGGTVPSNALVRAQVGGGMAGGRRPGDAADGDTFTARLGTELCARGPLLRRSPRFGDELLVPAIGHLGACRRGRVADFPSSQQQCRKRRKWVAVLLADARRNADLGHRPTDGWGSPWRAPGVAGTSRTTYRHRADSRLDRGDAGAPGCTIQRRRRSQMGAKPLAHRGAPAPLPTGDSSDLDSRPLPLRPVCGSPTRLCPGSGRHPPCT